MKTKKFLEISKAKSLALLTAVTIVVLYITKNLIWVPQILMIFLGLTALIRVKVLGVFLSEKKKELKKGFVASLFVLIPGFFIKSFFEVNLFVELILLGTVLLLLGEVYSEKKEKWINAFVLMGSFLVFSGIVLFLSSLIENQIFLL